MKYDKKKLFTPKYVKLYDITVVDLLGEIYPIL